MFIGTLTTAVLVSGNTSNLIYLEMCFVYIYIYLKFKFKFKFKIFPVFKMWNDNDDLRRAKEDYFIKLYNPKLNRK